MTIDLYGLPVSPPCINVLIVSKYLGVRVNLKSVNPGMGEHLKPSYMKINPQHTIPTMDDNGFILWESRPIMLYLVMKYAKNDSLYPKDPQTRGLIEQRLYFDIGTLYESIISYHGPVIFGKTNMPPEHLYSPMERAFELLDTYLMSSRFVAGDSLTLADFSIMTSSTVARAFGFDIDRYENVSVWHERCRKLLEKSGFDDIVEAGTRALAAYYRANLKG